LTAHIKLLPSGKEFVAQDTETVLEAALRSGVSISYSCNNGTCGECKAHLLSGRVNQLVGQDYCFSEAEKNRNAILLCNITAASDLEIEVHEANSAQDIPLQKVPTRVDKLERLSNDIMVVHLRTPRSQTLNFLAGQHVSLEAAGIPPRNKSIASCPCNAMHLQFHIRHVPDDPFSEHVFTKLKVADTVTINGPMGDFLLDEESKRPIIFFAYETGFGPVKSIIEHAIALDLQQPIHLYWLAREGEFYLGNYCRSWEDALDNFTYTPLVIQSGVEGNDPFVHPEIAAKNFVMAGQRVGADHPDLSGFDCYLSGPESTMQPLIEQLETYGLQKDRLKVDFMQRY
jgi:CDP-4-dehydro-6-deoxyglucose reductase